MSDDRCFRIDELDVEELRDRRFDTDTIHAYENWIRDFAPSVDDIISRLTAAFADFELDDGLGLWESQGLDDYASAEELKELRSKDEKLDWRKIPIERMRRCYAAPFFMDARGFVFHLPAFLIAELNDQHIFGFIDRLYCSPESPAGWSDLLNADQRNALAAALQLIGAHPDYHRDADAIKTKIDQLNTMQKMG